MSSEKEILVYTSAVSPNMVKIGLRIPETFSNHYSKTKTYTKAVSMQLQDTHVNLCQEIEALDIVAKMAAVLEDLFSKGYRFDPDYRGVKVSHVEQGYVGNIKLGINAFYNPSSVRPKGIRSLYKQHKQLQKFINRQPLAAQQ